MTHFSARIFNSLLLVWFFSTAAGAAWAQNRPAKPITIVMEFPAGSAIHVIARTLQDPIENAFNAKIITDYQSGAGGNIASEAVVKAFGATND